MANETHKGETAAREAMPRLIPQRDAMPALGIKSPTTLGAMVKRGELPKVIRRGRQNYFVESELREYVQRLLDQRAAA